MVKNEERSMMIEELGDLKCRRGAEGKGLEMKERKREGSMKQERSTKGEGRRKVEGEKRRRRKGK